MKHLATDEIRIRRGLLIFFLVVVSIGLAHFGLSRGMPLVGLAIPGVFLVCQLFSQPARLFLLILFLNTIQLKLPGLPKTLSLLVLTQVLMIGWSVLDAAIKHQKKRFSFRPGVDMWIAVFLINVFLLMAARGAGFARLGGSVFGGAKYAMLIVAILFYFAAVRVRLSDKDVKTLLLLVFAGALTYAVMEMLVYYFAGTFGRLSQFVSFAFNERTTARAVTKGLGEVRWHSYRGLAFALLPLAYVWCRQKSRRFWMVFAAGVLVALSGFRSLLVQMGLMIFMLEVYYSRSRVRTVVVWMLIGIAGLGFLMVATPYLPLTIQRAVSFIPFLSVDESMIQVAESSSNWRFDLWQNYCIPNVSKFLLIGRGLSHDITGFAWLSRKWYGSAEFFYHMGSYHSGPFDLLLTYGLLGTISFTMFFGMTVADGWRTVRRYGTRMDSLAAKYYAFLTVWMTYELVAFFLIFGDVKSQLFLFLAIAAQMRILKKNFLMDVSPEATDVGDQIVGIRK